MTRKVLVDNILSVLLIIVMIVIGIAVVFSIAISRGVGKKLDNWAGDAAANRYAYAVDDIDEYYYVVIEVKVRHNSEELANQFKEELNGAFYKRYIVTFYDSHHHKTAEYLVHIVYKRYPEKDIVYESNIVDIDVDEVEELE